MRFSLLRPTGRWAVVFTLALLPWASGCGSGGTGTVTGKVTYQGNVVKGGTVTFIGKTQNSVAQIGEDGKYTAEKVPVGEVKIAVETKSLASRAALAGRGSLPKEIAGKGTQLSPEDAQRRYVPIPTNYASADTSGLTYTVKAGSQEHDLPLAGAIGPDGPGGRKGSSKPR